MHATVRIECSKEAAISIGTGFFYNLFLVGDKAATVIVTNKHVVKGAKSGFVELTRAKPDGSPDIGNHFRLDLPNFESGWIDHPDSGVDLTIYPISTVLESLASNGRRAYWIGLDQSIVPTEEQLRALTPVEQVLVVGYPIGIWDTRNNAPVFRRGITATSPYLDFSGKPEFLIDAAIFPGSSGSPVLLYNEGGWTSRNGGISLGGRLFLLGVNYAVMNYKSTGEIVIQETPTEMRPVPTLPIPGNLGVCVKAEKILDFEPLAVEMGFKPPDGYVMRALGKREP